MDNSSKNSDHAFENGFETNDNNGFETNDNGFETNDNNGFETNDDTPKNDAPQEEVGNIGGNIKGIMVILGLGILITIGMTVYDVIDTNNILNSNPDKKELFEAASAMTPLYMLLVGECVYCVGHCIACAGSIWGFLKRKKDACSLAVVALVSSIVSNLISLFFGFDSANIKSCVVSAILLGFIFTSKEVKEYLPLPKWDYKSQRLIISTAILVIGIIMMITSTYSLNAALATAG